MLEKGHDSVIQEIKSRVLLSSIIKQNVELKKAGPNFIGRCPFHNEKTPSFNVRDKEGHFKCFGCGTSGDHFNFLMKFKGISFLEALEELKIKAGITLVSSTKKHSKDSRYYYVLKVAQNFFHKYLLQSPQVIDYLNSRGVNLSMAKEAMLGYCPSSSDLLIKYLAKYSITTKEAYDFAILKKDYKTPYFADRLIFPIYNNLDKCVAFGARSLVNDPYIPKYINSPSNEFYEKKSTFYGLYESKAALNKGEIPYIVEGYFDAMAFWKIGLPALALCGTSFSLEHIAIIKKFTNNIAVCFDLDKAGVNALKTALIIAFEHLVNVNMIVIDEKDPGVYLENKSLNILKDKISNQKDAFCFLLDLASIKCMEGFSQKITEINNLLPVFQSIKKDILKRQYVSYFSSKINEDVSVLWQEINKQKYKKQEVFSSLKSVKIEKSYQENIIIYIYIKFKSFNSYIENNLLKFLSDEIRNLFIEISSYQDLTPEIIKTIFAKYNMQTKWIFFKEQDELRLSEQEALSFLNSFYESFLKKEHKEKLVNNFYKLKKCESSNIVEILKNLKQHTELLSSRKENNANIVYKPLENKDNKLDKKVENFISIFDEEDCF